MNEIKRDKEIQLSILGSSFQVICSCISTSKEGVQFSSTYLLKKSQQLIVQN